MLYFAYKFDLPSACKDGKLIFTNHYNQKKVFQAYENLSVSDLENLASVAFDQGSYDHAIEIINAIMDIQESSNINTGYLCLSVNIFGYCNFIIKVLLILIISSHHTNRSLKL